MSPSPTANVRSPDNDAIAAAGALIREGRLVAFPTETVYGLGGDATSDRAVAAIFEAKGRPRFNPLIVHFTETAAVAREVEMDDRARRLAEAFWPGPLSLVLRRKAGCRISLLASAGLETVAVRLPANDIARALIGAAGRPLAAPSANRFGGISPTTAAHVAEALDGIPAMILDGGPSAVGIESTVVDLSGAEAALLRPGAVTREQIEAVIGALSEPADEPDGGPQRSPGRLLRHYAPRHPLRIDAAVPRPGEALLAFGPDVPEGATLTRNLSPSGDLVEAAANLFSLLHELDARAGDGIAVMPVPETGLGAAINDRLRRAAEPLPDAEATD